MCSLKYMYLKYNVQLFVASLQAGSVTLNLHYLYKDGHNSAFVYKLLPL